MSTMYFCIRNYQAQIKLRVCDSTNLKIESFYKLIQTEPGNDNLEPFSDDEPSLWDL
jgi:hypothetical protein